MSAQEFHCTATGGQRAIDVLAEHCPLPRQRIKDALTKGAVWLRRGGGREQRLRRATRVLQQGDQLSLYYDAEVLALVPPEPALLADEGDYSVWCKPAGMLAQGTRFGDHCALLHWSERAFDPPRTGFLVHRLDREAEGLMLIAHTRRAADALSQLWQSQQIHKQYAVTVTGQVGAPGERRRIDTALDGKTAITEFEVVDVDEAGGRSTLSVTLITGRKHQIRRHLAGIGHAVVGDYRYGRGGEPLALRAVALQFQCPLSRRARNYRIDAGTALPAST